MSTPFYIAGCQYTQNNSKTLYEGLAVFNANDTKQPMFIIPLDCTSIHDIVSEPDSINVGILQPINTK